MDRAAILAILARAFVVVLATVLAVSTAIVFVQGGITDALIGLAATYMALVLGYGVFTDRLFDPEVQIALFTGVVVWAGYNYLLGDGGTIDLILAVLGAFIVISQTRKLLATRGTTPS